jgi:hypothetical protein
MVAVGRVDHLHATFRRVPADNVGDGPELDLVEVGAGAVPVVRVLLGPGRLVGAWLSK